LNQVKALERYLDHVIDSNQRLQLQGIRSSGELVSIELEKIYVTLCTIAGKSRKEEERWLDREVEALPGETLRQEMRSFEPPQQGLERMELKIQQALYKHQRLVVVGDPGCGKTTLLCYIALTYARNWTEAQGLVQKRLGLPNPRLPILLFLRDFATHLQHTHPDQSLDGPALLLDYLHKFFANQEIRLPEAFFTGPLEKGTCVVLLDGMDEVAKTAIRRRIARIIERFTRCYPDNRYVVTSRVKGYTDSVRLGETYAVAKVRDFSREDMKQFLTHWNRAVEAVLAGGDTESSRKKARRQSRALLAAIDGNDRVRELAVNPLLLTVIALVQRYRAKLPERRTELYEEAVEVLLGKWDAAKGMKCTQDELDAGDCRSLLEPVALAMMEQRRREIDAEALHHHLTQQFCSTATNNRRAEKRAERFLARINERSGLVTERGQGTYSFSHLTFQEHLAARAVADRKDYIDYTLKRIADSWWREVVLLMAGYLSTQGRQRATDLIRAVMDHKEEPEPYHNLVLAADCLRDVGQVRVTGDLWQQVKIRLKTAFELPLRKTGVIGRVLQTIRVQPTIDQVLQGRALAAEALARIDSNTPGTRPAFWRLPRGEPVWVEVPAGKFYMGEDGEQHQLHLEAFLIAKTPITNAQYDLFVRDAGHSAPDYWADGRPPRGLESHPVVYVTWNDAMAYCDWLSRKMEKSITLPSEAQWEKAARGKDKRIYPWGDEWEPGKCNSSELGLGQTTPVGIFPEGRSPYGCLDMSGNVWEWTRSLWGKGWGSPEFKYPYNPADGRENTAVKKELLRVLRGGSWNTYRNLARCSYRSRVYPRCRYDDSGFRVAVSPISSGL
jgi:formylglycine-generating enzyme required for sulfatase activity/energy-coupling factor transporter ATP-binding protein EcfA2